MLHPTFVGPGAKEECATAGGVWAGEEEAKEGKRGIGDHGDTHLRCPFASFEARRVFACFFVGNAYLGGRKPLK